MNISEIKSISLDILIAIDDFCRKNSINYSLSGGTALGGVRHKGFIPWDDDIDIMLPRPDYDRLCIEWKDTESFKLYSLNRNNTKIPYARICEMKKTVVVPPALWNIDKSSGVWVDIFPVDGVSDNFEEFSNQIQQSKILIDAILESRFVDTSISNHSYNWKGLLMVYLRRFAGLNKTNKRLLHKHLILRNEKPYASTSHLGMLAITNYGDKEWFSTELFNEYMDIEFEGRKFRALKHIDDYLTKLYGDYMVLPPVEQRVQTHSAHKYLWR